MREPKQTKQACFAWTPYRQRLHHGSKTKHRSMPQHKGGYDREIDLVGVLNSLSFKSNIWDGKRKKIIVAST